VISLTGKSINVRLATKMALVALVLASVMLTAMLVREKKRDTADLLRQAMDAKLLSQFIEPAATEEAPETLDSAEMAKLVSDNNRLWGPLIPPPPRPPKRPPPPPNLARMAKGLSIVAIIGDPSSGDPVKFLINDNGMRSLKAKGDKLREFVIKGYDSEGLTLQFQRRTYTLPLAGK